MPKHRIYTMSFARVYPELVAKAERKGRTKAEVDQIIGWCHVVLLSGAKVEADRQAQRIDYCVDFGAEPAARPAKSLGFLAPLFSGAPAACA